MNLLHLYKITLCNGDAAFYFIIIIILLLFNGIFIPVKEQDREVENEWRVKLKALKPNEARNIHSVWPTGSNRRIYLD